MSADPTSQRPTPDGLDPSDAPGDPGRGVVRRVLDAGVGLVAGILAGTAVTLVLVVLRAAAEEIYLHGVEDVWGWLAAPGVAVALAGGVLGWLGRLSEPLVGAGAGVALGAALGGILGAVLVDDATGPWAGAVVGAGGGLLLGAAVGPLGPARHVGAVARHARARLPSGPIASGLAAAALLGIAALAVTAGDEAPPLPAPGSVPAADSADVTTAVLFVGDAGEGTLGRFPVLVALAQAVERWSAILGPDGRVAVVYLGDLVYPGGLSDPDSPAWPRDSVHLAHQIAAVAGPAARRAGARGIFVAGNHDWGEEEDWKGAVRVQRLQAFVDRVAATGPRVSLEPDAGTGGPAVVDLGDDLRLVLLDTAWWLLEGEPANRAATVAGVEAALEGAGGRPVVMAAHHPFASAGPHGSRGRLGTSLGLRTLLSRSGALLQDLRSEPYRLLLDALLDVFGRVGPPRLFAGGHEHSLQVVRSDVPGEPPVSLVSGSASKITRVGHMGGLAFGAAAPGFATLLVKRDGSLELRVDATPPGFLRCPGGAGLPGSPAADARPAGADAAATPRPDAGVPCMARALAAFRTVWADTI